MTNKTIPGAQANEATAATGRRRTLKLAAALALLPAVAISGCGQKGPLYVPDSETEQDRKKSSG